MRKSEWSDKELEELLERLPKISDRQIPDELYRKINVRMQDEQIRQSRKKIWVLPSVATVAALFLIFLIGSQFLSISDEANQSVKNESASKESAESSKADVGILQKAEGNESFDDEGSLFDSTKDKKLMRMDIPMTSEILMDYSDEFSLITIGIPDIQAQNVIPVSMLAPEKSVTRLDALQEVLINLSEEELGLEQHFFDGVKLQEEGDKVIITVPEEFNGNNFPGDSYPLAVQETFRWMDYKVAELRRVDGGQVTLGNYGSIETISLDKEMNKGYYKYYSPNGSTFLVPSRDPSETFLDAIFEMSKPIPTQNLLPSIPDSLKLVVEDKGSNAIITFSNMVEDNEENSLMIKAILLTAREFGIREVTFNNTADKIGWIDLKIKGNSKPVKVPVAPNYMELPTK